MALMAACRMLRCSEAEDGRRPSRQQRHTLCRPQRRKVPLQGEGVPRM